MESAKVVILDIRLPTVLVLELQRHQACVNAIAWAPCSASHICTASDDSQVVTSKPKNLARISYSAD